MRALLRWWLANAGSITVPLLFAIYVPLLLGWPAGVPVVLVLAGLSLVQGLRNLWLMSRPKAVALGLGLPTLLVGLLVREGTFDGSALLFFLPAALAAIAEAVVRRWRGSHGLPVVAEPAPPVSVARRHAAGCATVAVLAIAFSAATCFSMLQPSRDSAACRASLRPGMTLADVAIAAWPHGRYYAFVNQAEGAPLVRLAPGRAAVGDEGAEGEAAVRALLDRHAPRLGLVSVSFSFRGLGPIRSGFTVEFGPDGRVARIGEQHNRDD
ncbi:MAG: hypothetical protein NDJ94_21110 [Vicinamibacteria bacterium]|nr:hypothetical protein [Vicinamibacteria bacterium]